MKHIKLFNESIITDQFLSDLVEFCEMNLVYLMDDGLDVSVTRTSLDHLSLIKLRYPLAPGTFELLVQKDWNSVKDTIIPFFTRLNSDYNVVTFGSLLGMSSSFDYFSNPLNQVQFGLRRSTVVNSALSNGGFRKNFTVDDILGDRLDLGNNFIVENTTYISMRGLL